MLTESLEPEQLKQLVGPLGPLPAPPSWGPPSLGGQGGLSSLGVHEDLEGLKSRNFPGDFSPLSSRHSMQWEADRDRDKDRDRDRGTGPPSGYLDFPLLAAEDWREDIIFCIIDCLQAQSESRSKGPSSASLLKETLSTIYPASLAARLSRYSNRLKENFPRKDLQGMFFLLLARMQKAPWVHGYHIRAGTGAGPGTGAGTGTESGILRGRPRPGVANSSPPRALNKEMIDASTRADAVAQHDRLLIRQSSDAGDNGVLIDDATYDKVFCSLSSQHVYSTGGSSLSPSSSPTPSLSPSRSSSPSRSPSRSILSSAFEIDLTSSHFTSNANIFQAKKCAQAAGPVILRRGPESTVSTTPISSSLCLSEHSELDSSGMVLSMLGRVSTSAVLAGRIFTQASISTSNSTVITSPTSGSTSNSPTRESIDPHNFSKRAGALRTVEIPGPRSVQKAVDQQYALHVIESRSAEKENHAVEIPFSNRAKLENSINSATHTLEGSKRSSKDNAYTGFVPMQGTREIKSPCKRQSISPSNKLETIPSNLIASRSSPLNTQRSSGAEHSVEESSPLNESSQTHFWMLSDSDSDDDLGRIYGDEESTCLFDDSR